MKLRYISPVALAMSATPALADRIPPANALPLSVICGFQKYRTGISLNPGQPFQ